MVEPIARIRPFQASDDKLVRFTIGKATMESLAVANRRAYKHWMPVSVWLILSFCIVGYMNMWPTNRFGFISYLHPVPVLAAAAVPIMFLIDWLNRPVFEQLVQDVLRGPDMSDIASYYSRSPSSGFWILDYGELFVGLIALDASHDSLSTSPTKALPKATGNKNKNKGPKLGTAPTATIRHFYVDETYRSSGIQEDLLTHATRFAFNADPTLKRIRAPDSPLISYIRDCLRNAGFVLEEHTKTVGAFGWKLGMRGLDREDWATRSKAE